MKTYYKCRVCGTGLKFFPKLTFNGKTNEVLVELEPCSKCIKTARNDAYESGLQDGRTADWCGNTPFEPEEQESFAPRKDED